MNEPTQRRQPTPSRPQMPAGYGLPDTPPDPATASWDRAQEQLATARNYWVATASPSGRPHTMPVWGLWLDERFLFSTGRRSRKGRDLAANPEVAVNLESGDNVVILEGSVEEVQDADLLARFVDAYDVKYAIRPNTADPQDAVYALRPRVAFTWQESDFLQSAARWRFETG